MLTIAKEKKSYSKSLSNTNLLRLLLIGIEELTVNRNYFFEMARTPHPTDLLTLPVSRSQHDDNACDSQPQACKGKTCSTLT